MPRVRDLLAGDVAAIAALFSCHAAARCGIVPGIAEAISTMLMAATSAAMSGCCSAAASANHMQIMPVTNHSTFWGNSCGSGGSGSPEPAVQPRASSFRA